MSRAAPVRARPAPGGGRAGGGKPQEDVVEADYEIVDDTKK